MPGARQLTLPGEPVQGEPVNVTPASVAEAATQHDALRGQAAPPYTSSRRALGQYFTPDVIVEFVYDALEAVRPELVRPAIIDPACGDGAFLGTAIERSVTTPERIWGIEKDAAIAAAWDESGLLARLDGRLVLGDGLDSTALPSHMREGQFDLVVGNPPFARVSCSDVPGGERFLTWRRFAAGRTRGRRRGRPVKVPLEALFLERFAELAAPGGTAAIVLPDGVLANRRLAFLRQWLLTGFTVHAIVAFPRGVFSKTGTTAKTNVIIFSKQRPDPGRCSLLADVDGREPVLQAARRVAQSLRGLQVAQA